MQYTLGIKRLTLGLLILVLSALAHAGGSPPVGIAITGGLSGVGTDIAIGLSDHFDVRGTVAGYNLNRDGSYGTTTSWRASIKLLQGGLLIDYRPLKGTFHLSAGVVDDGNQLKMRALTSGGTFKFNGTAYPSGDISSASASVEWSKAVLYLGMGWGNLASARGFHLISDIGVLFAGHPKANVDVNCSAQGEGENVCGQLSTDVAAEQSKLQNDADKLSFWPILRVGVGYTF